MKFAFIDAEKAHFPITVMCRVLGVSRAGFYAWKTREPSKHDEEDELLRAHIVSTFEATKKTYGSPRIKKELDDEGIQCGRHRIARLMRESSICARPKRRFVKTTDSAHKEVVPDNVLKRDFTATRPNEKWVTDITYLPTAKGFIYLAVMLDLFSRRVVGSALSDGLEADLALRALDSALATRKLSGPLIHHSDRGVQYVSNAYVERLNERGICRSMSRRGNCWDNAPAESFFSTLKMELPEATSGVLHPKDVAREVIDYIARYNLERRHSSIGYVSPVEYEAAAQTPRAA